MVNQLGGKDKKRKIMLIRKTETTKESIGRILRLYYKNDEMKNEGKIETNSGVSQDLISQYTQYNDSVGVHEGYTLLEHTNAVLGQFDKYFGKDFAFDKISKDYFRLLLMIHDIGKPDSTKAGLTDHQHMYSEPLIRKILSDKGYNQELIEFGVNLVCMDPIGKLLKGEITSQEAVIMIYNAYQKTPLVAHQMYLKLLMIYYSSDASSYTADANKIPSLDYLFDFSKGRLLFQQDIQLKLDILLKDWGEYNYRPYQEKQFTTIDPEQRDLELQNFIKGLGKQPDDVVVRIFDQNYLDNVHWYGTDRYFKKIDNRSDIHEDVENLDQYLSDNNYDLKDGFYGYQGGEYPEDSIGKVNPKRYAVLIYDKNQLTLIDLETRVFKNTEKKKEAILGVYVGEKIIDTLEEDYNRLTSIEQKKNYIKKIIAEINIDIDGPKNQLNEITYTITDLIAKIRQDAHFTEEINIFAKQYLNLVHGGIKLFAINLDTIGVYHKGFIENLGKEETYYNRRILDGLDKKVYAYDNDMQLFEQCPKLETVYRQIQTKHEALKKEYDDGNSNKNSSK